MKQTLLGELLKQSIGAKIGLGFIIILLILAISAPIISFYDPLKMDAVGRLSPPSFEHLMGQDEFGRDVLSRILHGSRASLIVGLIVIPFSAAIGSIIGAIAGFYGGIIDSITMRLADIFFAFPSILLAIAIMAALGPGFSNLVLSLILINWTGYARIVRGEALKLREVPFIEAKIAMGAKDFHILVDIIKNSFSPIIVIATIGIGWAILAEAGLSFIGLGVPPPEPSWGNMIASGRNYTFISPHISIFAGLAISLTVLSFNLIGDALRDILDPKLKI